MQYYGYFCLICSPETTALLASSIKTVKTAVLIPPSPSLALLPVDQDVSLDAGVQVVKTFGSVLHPSTASVKDRAHGQLYSVSTALFKTNLCGRRVK